MDISFSGLLAAGSYESLFLIGAGVLAVGMLLWDTIEVGRNDAANLVNAVIGARVLDRRLAVYIAGFAVVVGAAASSPVIETARKGIFDPSMLTIQRALAVYTAVYIVDTVLLYGYSAFGMPVSTTACLVFELLGASLALGGFGIVNWGTAGNVVAAIVLSILITGVAAFVIQRLVRRAIGEHTHNPVVLLTHGGWVAGGMLAGVVYFLLVKGMKKLPPVQAIRENLIGNMNHVFVVLILWIAFGLVIQLLLFVFPRRAARLLFPALAIIGTIAMAVAFGQNDLANAAAPGLAALNLLQHWDTGVAAATDIPIATWALAGCGALMAVGMTTRNSRRVTDAAVHAGSMAHQVRLWAPAWCRALARLLLRFRSEQPVLAPLPQITETGKKMHYDVLRACVILTVSASVIASASSLGLPVSTTYVAFAAIVATGMADRIFQRGDAELKLARTIWVVFSWFAAAAIATVAAGVAASLVYYGGFAGIVIGVGANLTVRRVLKQRADRQEARVREATRERKYPEMYADEDEDA